MVLIQFRLNSAAIQLATGIYTGEVADVIGCNSPSQFIREFKRQFGQSLRISASSASAQAQFK